MRSTIGAIMMVTGAAQLVMAPVATALERRVDTRLFERRGLCLARDRVCRQWLHDLRDRLLGVVLAADGARRGGDALSVADHLAGPRRLRPFSIPNASGLFNLMRNLGGAIGLALIDTVLGQRTPIHVAAIVARLQAGDPVAARLVGLPTERFTGYRSARSTRRRARLLRHWSSAPGSSPPSTTPGS